MAKFVLTTCAACFARQNPVSTSANPACMKITRTAPMMIHRLLSPSAVFALFSLVLMSIDGSSAQAPAVDDQHEHRGDRPDDRDPASSSVSHVPPVEEVG